MIPGGIKDLIAGSLDTNNTFGTGEISARFDQAEMSGRRHARRDSLTPNDRGTWTVSTYDKQQVKRSRRLINLISY